MSDFSPGRNRAESVHRYLLDAIHSGRFGAGDQLPTELTLAATLGVSRPVIREAISKLAADGIVRAEQGRGTFVSDLPATRRLNLSPIENVDDLIAWQDLRVAVEQESARLAAIRHGPKDLENIVRVHERLMETAQFGERDFDVDFEFHLAIAHATHNPVLVNAQQSLGEHIRNWMKMMLKATRQSSSERNVFRNREHQAIIDAISRTDPDAAAMAARRHIENGRTRLLTEISAARQIGPDAAPGRRAPTARRSAIAPAKSGD
jgi:GntR family transcriptional repressor for pyruvate dehydrogenase complex